MKNTGKVIVLLVLIAVLIAGAVGFYFKGDALMALTNTKLKQVTAASCGETWTKVFEGKLAPPSVVYNENGEYPQYPMAVTKGIKWSELYDLMSQGCSFKVVRAEASGGWGGQTALECSVAGTYGGDGIFACRTPAISSDGTPNESYYDQVYDGVMLSFGEYPTVYYVPFLDHQADSLSVMYVTVSIFVKK